MTKKRKIPQRKCIVTNELKPKQEMIRVVRNKDGEVSVDPTGKKNGRGAYMTINATVIQQAKEQRILEKTFQRQIDDSVYDDLEKLVSD